MGYTSHTGGSSSSDDAGTAAPSSGPDTSAPTTSGTTQASSLSPTSEATTSTDAPTSTPTTAPTQIEGVVEQEDPSQANPEMNANKGTTSEEAVAGTASTQMALVAIVAVAGVAVVGAAVARKMYTSRKSSLKSSETAFSLDQEGPSDGQVGSEVSNHMSAVDI